MRRVLAFGTQAQIIGSERFASWMAKPHGSRSMASSSPAGVTVIYPISFAPAASSTATLALTSSQANARCSSSGSIAE